MDHLVDLDDLAARLAVLVEEWRKRVDVSPFTWRDERASWPQPILNDRAKIEVPESLGFKLFLGGDECEVVVWTGGWADLFIWVGDQLVPIEFPEFRNTDEAYEVVLRNVSIFLD